MRTVERLTGLPLELTPTQLVDLGIWLKEEHDISDSAYHWIREGWMDELRQYNGFPRNMNRVSPREDAPNIEITIGALACDVICAQIIDLYFQVSPVLTVKPRAAFDTLREAFQMFLDWMTSSRIKLRQAVDDYTLDDVQLGSAVYYCPWKEAIRKTDSVKVVDAGPEMIAWPIEDVDFPPNPERNVQKMRWVSLHMMLNKSDLLLRKKRDGWNPDFDLMNPKTSIDPVKQRRLDLAGQQGSDPKLQIGQNYDIRMTWALRDIDDDFVDEDICVVWDRESGHVLKALYNEYDSRPIVLGQYQQRAHLPLGIGVMKMARPYEDEVTDIHSMRTDNMYLVNNRAWKARDAIADSLTQIWPGKVVAVTDMDDLESLEMADIYDSSGEAEKITMAYFERRVGMTELSQPSKLGGRTPGVTAQTVVTKANQRFTPVLDNHRNATAEAAIQCLYRYQEKLNSQDAEQKAQATKDVDRVFAKVEGGASLKKAFVEAMTQDEYDLRDMFDLYITASSVTINRMQDQQALLQLSQIMEKYIAGETQAAMALDNPQTGPNMKETVTASREAVRALMKRIIYTFTQIADNNHYVLDVEAQDAPPIPPLVPEEGGGGIPNLGGNQIANRPPNTPGALAA